MTLTEPEMIDRLRAKYTRVNGNGPLYVFTDHVKSGAGHYRGSYRTGDLGSHRTIDALVMAITLGGKLELTAFEVKSSRSDWLREKADPTKAAAFTDKVDKFVLVAGGPDIVRPGELPDRWGLMVPHGLGLKFRYKPKPLYERPATGRKVGGHPEPDYTLPEGFDRSFLAALLRSVSRGPSPDVDRLEKSIGDLIQAADQHWDPEHMDAAIDAARTDLAAIGVKI